MNKFILAQIFGIIGSFAMILSSWQKKRKRILSFLLFDNLFYFLQYIILRAFSGAFVNLIGLVRLALFSKKGESKFFKTNFPLYIVIFLYLIVNIFTYDGITSLFPAIAAIIYAFVLWQDKEKNIRKGTAITLFLWILYGVFVKAYVSATSDGIQFISALIAIYKLDIKTRNENRINL